MQLRVDFSDIVPIKGAKTSGFEEMVCQLAEYDYAKMGRMYRSEGAGGDGGVETYLVLPDATEWGWQAKYFLDGLTPSRKVQIKKSLNKTLAVHPKCRKWYLALPCNLTPPTSREGESELTWWQGLQREYEDRGVELVLWHKTALLNMLMRPEHRGRLLFWFGVVNFSKEWFRDSVNATLSQLKPKYQEKLHVRTDVDNLLKASCTGYKVTNDQRQVLDSLYGKIEGLGTLLHSTFPENDHIDIRRLAAFFRRTVDSVRTSISQTARFSDRPLTDSEARLASNIVDQAYDRFERRLARVSALRDRLAKLYDYGLDDLNLGAPSGCVRESDLWDPHLGEYLREQKGVPYSLWSALQHCSGGLESIRIIETPGVEESFPEDMWDGLGTDSEADASPAREFDDIYVNEVFLPIDQLDMPADAADEVPVMIEEDINKFVPSSNLGEVVTYLDETLVDIWNECSRLLRSLKNGFLASRSVIHVIAPPGAGKTHLFADVARTLAVAKDKPALLFTGDQFGPGLSIRSRILDCLGLHNLTWDEFLQGLMVAAQTYGSRAMILIDAINESPAVSIWRSNLAAFEASFQSNPYLCLATSCRSTYKDYIWPDGEPDDAIHLQHPDESMDDMVRRYLRYYKIQVEFDTPDSSDVFSNPLYLRLFCEVHGDPNRVGLAKVVTGRDSVFGMFDAFLAKCARAIAEKTDEDPVNVKAFWADLGDLFWKSRRTYIPWSRLSDRLIDRFGHQPWNRSVAKALLGEDLLLRKELSQGASHITMFTYEQLGDYVISKYGLMRSKQCSTSVLQAIPWSVVANHPRGRSLIEYLALSTPREVGRQLWEFAPKEPLFISAVLSTMGQLSPHLLRESDVEWIESCLTHGYPVLALRTLFECSMVPGSRVSADRIADWRDMIGPERWRKWAFANSDLVEKLVVRMERRQDLNLAILAWLFYAATRSKRLYNALSKFTDGVPPALRLLRSYSDGIEA